MLFVGCCNLLVVEHQGPVELVVDIGQLGFDLEQARNIRSVDLLYTPVEYTVYCIRWWLTSYRYLPWLSLNWSRLNWWRLQ